MHLKLEGERRGKKVRNFSKKTGEKEGLRLKASTFIGTYLRSTKKDQQTPEAKKEKKKKEQK